MDLKNGEYIILENKINFNQNNTSINVFSFIKDSNLKFVNCSENLAALSGADSPIQMQGKDDYVRIPIQIDH